MIKEIVVIDIGHGFNTYPPSKGIGNFAEHVWNSKVAEKVKELAEHNNFKIVYSQEPLKNDVKLQARTGFINDLNKKTKILAIVSIHANASENKIVNGKGVFYSKGSVGGKKLAKIWLEESKVLNLNNWGGSGLWVCEKGTWTDFYIVQKTVPVCILLEHFFYTNPKELKKCNTKEFINLSAKVIVKSLCRYANKQYKEKEPIQTLPTQKEKLYKVQVGAYKNLYNAKELEKRLEKEGHKPFIKLE